MFFGLPDPDPLVRRMDPDPALDPDPSIIMQNNKKNLESYCSARTGTRIGLLEEIPRSGVQIPCLYLKVHYRCTRSLCYQAQTPV